MIVSKRVMLPTLLALALVTSANAQTQKQARSGASTSDKTAHTKKSATQKSKTSATRSKDSEKEKKTVKKKPKRRIVSIQGGKVRLDVRSWPLIGSPGAKYVFVEMFDYTCPHCRKTHKSIDGARKRYGEDLAILALPVPLNQRCHAGAGNNPLHAEACDLAKIAIAVWRVSPAKFEEFHGWLFQQHRTARDARRKAEQTVGKEKLAKELRLPYADRYIASHVKIYRKVNGGNVPKILFPRSTVVGDPGSASILCGMIERELGPRKK